MKHDSSSARRSRHECSAEFHSAVSPIFNRQAVPISNPIGFALPPQVENLRYSRLEICATRAGDPSESCMNHLTRLVVGFVACLLSLLSVSAADKPVSYYNELVPIFKRSCNGCHHPGKLKGQLDLTTFEAFKKGGKHGPGFVEGKPKEST